MKIKVPCEQERSVADYVEGELDDRGGDYGRGMVENMDASLDRTKAALGRMCDLLAEKGILNAIEITYIARGWEDDAAVFVAGPEE